MLTRHQQKAVEFRAYAVQARAKAAGAVLPQVQETQLRVAEKWEALAEFEDMYVRGALARMAALQDPKATPS